MPMFDAMNAAGSGLSTYQTWLDALSDNIANVNTVEPTSGNAFQAEYVQAQAIATGDHGVGGGVQVVGIAHSSADGRLTYDPENPLADADGLRPAARHRHGRADGQPDHGPARLPGQRRRSSTAPTTPTNPPSTSARRPENMTIPAIGAISRHVAARPPHRAAAAPPAGRIRRHRLRLGAEQGPGRRCSPTQTNADNLAVKAATGDLTDISQYTIAATQASLVTQLASTLRTKGVDAFNQIMGMQA